MDKVALEVLEAAIAQAGHSEPLEAVSDHLSKKNSASFKRTISEDCSDPNALRRKRLCALHTDRQGLALQIIKEGKAKGEVDDRDVERSGNGPRLRPGWVSTDASPFGFQHQSAGISSTTRVLGRARVNVLLSEHDTYRLQALSKSKIQRMSFGFQNPENDTQRRGNLYGLEALGPVREPAAIELPRRSFAIAWTKDDDEKLLTLRQNGLNWSQIQREAWPAKTVNACRKRYERLTEQRNDNIMDSSKLERLSKEYMSMRKEIWAPLANMVGEKWNVVEAQCMSNGLKNIQSHARSYSRRQRLEAGPQEGDSPLGAVEGSIFQEEEY